jgi:hypothetical protein
MFRMIALVEVEPGTDIESLMKAARHMIEIEPNIRGGQVGLGLKLMQDYTPHADFSLMLDFDDEEAWRRYVAGDAHREMDELGMAHAVRVTATQYIVDD